jgi:hypothetical protein
MEVQSRTARHFRAGIRDRRLSFLPALEANAREEVLQNARLMMESALSSRTYTVNQVKPLLETHMKYEFLPQTVPAYAATEQFNELRKKHPDYSYKEATLNPTNPRNRAADWEADVVNIFRNTPAQLEMIGEREYAGGPVALPVAADPDQEQGVPRLPQHGRGRAQDDARPLRQRERLRLEDGRGDRRADRVGSHDRADRARARHVPDVHGLPRRGLRRHLRAAQPDALHDGDPASDAPRGHRRPGEPRQHGSRRVQEPQQRTRSVC